MTNPPPGLAIFASGLLQVAQRRFLLDRADAIDWGRRFLATGRDSLDSVRAVLGASDQAVAKLLLDLLPPNDRPIGGWTPCAQLGSGPLGSTWLAQRGDHQAAIKILTTDMASSTARAALQAALDQSLDLNKAQHVLRHLAVVTDGPAVALISPYIRGRDLDGRMRVRGAASERRGLRLARHLAKGLLRLHRAAGLHADLRPGNVLLTLDGRCLLTHHQLSIHAGAFCAGFDPATNGGHQWLAPELAVGIRPDERSDVYAAGCALYQFLADQEPFPGDPERQLLQHAKASRPDVRQRNGAVSERTALTIAKAMAIEPRNRFPSAEAFLRAILICRQTLPATHEADPADDRTATIIDHDDGDTDRHARPAPDPAEDSLATALPERRPASPVTIPSDTDAELSLTDSFLVEEPD